MQSIISDYLLSIMDDEYEQYFSTNELKSKGKIIGYSFQLLNRALLRVKTEMKSIYRIELYNFQGKDTDIKTSISTKYPIKESEQNGLRLITIDVPKEEETLLFELHEMEEALRRKMFDIYINFSPIEWFGCCSRYEECSDAKKCLLVEIDQIRARGCSYRKNLENGRIFYGKNRNI